MKHLVVLLSAVTLCCGFSLPPAAPACTQAVCKAPECYCSSTEPIFPDVSTIPQFVLISSDDAVSSSVYDDLWKTFMFDRKNADNCSVSGTHFVPHEYTDYSKVNGLWAKNIEIAVHSITKQSTTEHWANASEDDLVAEFNGSKVIIAKFANIPSADLIGGRVPYLNLAGDKLVNAYVKSGIKYDFTWASPSWASMYPYTLDFESTQPCLSGTCPQDSHKGFWILPINNWQGKNGQCNVLFSCSLAVNSTAKEIYDWMVTQFDNQYKDNRSPISIVVNSVWFQNVKNSKEAFKMFLDFLVAKKDVFLISHRQLLEYMKKPVTYDKYKSCQTAKTPTRCDAIVCPLKKGDETRYMTSCIRCPHAYPWLDNPEGN